MSAFERRYPVAHGLPRALRTSAWTQSPPPTSVSRTARLLALAQAIDRLCESEAGADYAHVARRLGMTRARVTQVSNLLHLSPVIQEAILDGRTVVSEHALRAIVQDADWERQSNAFARLCEDRSDARSGCASQWLTEPPC